MKVKQRDIMECIFIPCFSSMRLGLYYIYSTFHIHGLRICGFYHSQILSVWVWTHLNTLNPFEVVL